MTSCFLHLLCCSTLAWKIKAKLIWQQNCAQVQSIGVSVGNPCLLVSCEAIPVADLVLQDGAQGGGMTKAVPLVILDASRHISRQHR